MNRILVVALMGVSLLVLPRVEVPPAAVSIAAGCSPGPVSIDLPAPPDSGAVAVVEALRGRRSVREFSGQALTLEDLSSLLWAAQGTTAAWGGRTAPSAGALYPLEVIVVAGEVLGLEPGVYRYRGDGHSLARGIEGDLRKALAEAALGQAWVAEAPAVLVLSAVYRRTMKKYGDRGIRYAHIETGAAAENVCLRAVSLGLGTVLVGAFRDEDVAQVLDLGDEESPLALMPVGHPRGQ